MSELDSEYGSHIGGECEILLPKKWESFAPMWRGVMKQLINSTGLFTWLLQR